MSFHFVLGFFEIFWACFAWNIPQLLFIISLRFEKSKRFAVFSISEQGFKCYFLFTLKRSSFCSL